MDAGVSAGARNDGKEIEVLGEKRFPPFYII
jgi:hypothetical protein